MQENEKNQRPILLRLSMGSLGFSILSQVYFFASINGILSKDFSAMGIIEGIIEWSYLVGPSFFFSVAGYVLCLLLCIGSLIRTEDCGSTRWVVFGVAVVDLIVFMLITTFQYG